MNNDNGENCLRELVFIFRKVGSQAKAEQASGAEAQRCFHEGREAAFREALSFMKSHADIFGIPSERIGLGEFDPMVDELSLPWHLDTRG